jgi:hypothetical protein
MQGRLVLVLKKTTDGLSAIAAHTALRRAQAESCATPP